MDRFDKDYFERGLQTGKSAYENYRWIPELTIPLAHEITEVCSIGRNDKILDYGCAKGFLVKALRLLHYDAWGLDVSEYALDNAPVDIKNYLYFQEYPFWGLDVYLQYHNFDWLIAKDVFEHITTGNLIEYLLFFRLHIENMFVIVPLGKNGEYNAETNNMDPSHVICEDINWWIKLFKNSGYEVAWATTEMDYIKQSYNDIPDAHGFFKLKRK